MENSSHAKVITAFAYSNLTHLLYRC